MSTGAEAADATDLVRRKADRAARQQAAQDDPKSTGRPEPRRSAHPAPARAGGEALVPATVDWVPASVVTASSTALHRINGGAAGSLAVTSCARGEGRTTVAMGATIAHRNEFGHRTVLLELDVEHPSLAQLLGLPPAPGLSEVLAGEASLASTISWVAPSLGVVVAGTPPAYPDRLLWLFRRSSMLAQLRASGFSVVADLPPVGSSSSGDLLRDAFDTTLLVVRAGTTPVGAVRSAMAGFSTPPAVVLNGKSSAVPRWLRGALGG